MVRHPRAAVVVALVVLGSAGLRLSAYGQVRPDSFPGGGGTVQCGMNYTLGGLGIVLNPGNIATFTQQDVDTQCISVPPNIPAPCTYCFSWQLVRDLGGGVSQVVQPPYPVLYQIGVACDMAMDRDYTHTTPVLVPGAYDMSTTLWGAPCDWMGLIPTEEEHAMFTIVQR